MGTLDSLMSKYGGRPRFGAAPHAELRFDVAAAVIPTTTPIVGV